MYSIMLFIPIFMIILDLIGFVTQPITWDFWQNKPKEITKQNSEY